VADESNRAEALPAFAGAVAHEIRTPLAAVAGEVELALCRDRTVVEYQEALRRIGEGIAELIEITGDLSLLASDDFVGAESGSVLRFNIDRFPLKILPVDFPVRSWPVVIVTLKDRTLSSVVQSFIECAREVATVMMPKGAHGAGSRIRTRP